MPEPIVLSAHEEAVFAHLETLYGAHPEFAAARQPIRNLIAFITKNSAALVANPKLLSTIVAGVSLLFPAAAPFLTGLAPILAELGPLIALINNATTPAASTTAPVSGATDPLP